MHINESAVFKWVIIVGLAVWGLLIVIAGCVYGFRWLRDWQRNDPRKDDADQSPR